MPRRRSLLFLPLLVLAVLAAPGRGDINVQTTVADLGSDDYAVRCRATEALLADENLSTQDIQKLYRAATLPEQRQRLIDVAMHQFFRRVRLALAPEEGAKSMLGVKIALAPDAPQDPAVGRPALRITKTFPGYPAYVVLRPGDLIVSLNDQAVPVIPDSTAIQDKFIDQVQANPPGAIIRLGIFRDGKTLNVSLRSAGTNLELIYDRNTGAVVPPYDSQWADLRQELVNSAPVHGPLKVDLQSVHAAAPQPPLHLNEQPSDDAATEE